MAYDLNLWRVCTRRWSTASRTRRSPSAAHTQTASTDPPPTDPAPATDAPSAHTRPSPRPTPGRPRGPAPSPTPNPDPTPDTETSCAPAPSSRDRTPPPSAYGPPDRPPRSRSSPAPTPEAEPAARSGCDPPATHHWSTRNRGSGQTAPENGPSVARLRTVIPTAASLLTRAACSTLAFRRLASLRGLDLDLDLDAHVRGWHRLAHGIYTTHRHSHDRDNGTDADVCDASAGAGPLGGHARDHDLLLECRGPATSRIQYYEPEPVSRTATAPAPPGLGRAGWVC
jgi:hypothetical protein